NTIERAVLLSGGSVIEPRDLPPRLQGFATTEARPGPRLGDRGVDLRKAVETFENHLIRQALEKTNWNKKRAAELLGINRTTLVEMLKRKRIEAALFFWFARTFRFAGAGSPRSRIRRPRRFVVGGIF